MFLRKKKSGSRTYLQIVENRWEDGRSRQRVLTTLGRLENLQNSEQLEGLARSAARFCDDLLVLRAHADGEAPVISCKRLGPALIFERLWRETGCQQVVESLLAGRRFGFPVERAIFLTTLHRLMVSGSDRNAEKWREDYAIDGVGELQLHHLYRAMAWLGDELPDSQQAGATPFAPRTNKDLIEERLYGMRRDLFSTLDMVFFDTTSIYFEGEGGQTIGKRGKSKDHRPDLKQMVVGAVLDNHGYPVCCELWPGNTADVRSLVPIVDRLRRKFHIGRVCVVADRGMISQATLEALEDPARGWLYIIGARMRAQKEVREQVLSRAGRYKVVHPPRISSSDPSPLKVKDVRVEGRRYVVCLNEAQARKDAIDRELILKKLRSNLQQGGDKSLVGNKGFRRYLKASSNHFEIDLEKVKREERYDGKWVLRTNTDLSSAEVALKYKQLWTVEALFRSAKSLLDTRPIHHQRDETIRGHVFCSFLALVLRKELQDRLAARGHDFEWADVLRDLDALTLTEVERDGQRFVLRSEARGTCAKVALAVGVALPPTVRRTPTTEELGQ
jgi:hypothetical protein